MSLNEHVMDAGHIQLPDIEIDYSQYHFDKPSLFDGDNYNDVRFIEILLMIITWILVILLFFSNDWLSTISWTEMVVYLEILIAGLVFIPLWIRRLIRLWKWYRQYKQEESKQNTREEEMNMELHEEDMIPIQVPMPIQVSMPIYYVSPPYSDMIPHDPIVQQNTNINTIMNNTRTNLKTTITNFNQIQRQYESTIKRLYVAQTWQYSYGETMRKWLHGLGASQVKIDYAYDIQIAKFIYRNNQYMFSYYENDDYIDRDDIHRNVIHRFHLFSKTPDFNCDIRFSDITLMPQMLNGSRSFFGTDEVKGVVYPIFLGDGKENLGFEKI